MQDLEDEDGERFDNQVCIFLPEIVSPEMSQFNEIAENIDRLLEICPQISKVHILTFFMRVTCLQQFEQMHHFKNVFFYPVFLNNELCQYNCLISDRCVVEQVDNEFELCLDVLQTNQKTNSAVISQKNTDSNEMGEGLTKKQSVIDSNENQTEFMSSL